MNIGLRPGVMKWLSYGGATAASRVIRLRPGKAYEPAEDMSQLYPLKNTVPAKKVSILFLES